MQLSEFKKTVLDFYRLHGRSLPWRETNEQYCIYVSEMMLQQTQVSRVLEKYPEFLRIFPSFETLAGADTRELLSVWQGMGYNRRALYMRDSARIIVSVYGGVVPRAEEDLLKLPGIGPGTAGSLRAFIYNDPVIFIETNIRRVFLHHFFPDSENISDRELFPLIESTLDRRSPREWYYALMDYGSILGKKLNANVRSRHYTKQSRFEGSNRQIRGKIVRYLTKSETATQDELLTYIGSTPERFQKILSDLQSERFLTVAGVEIRLA